MKTKTKPTHTPGPLEVHEGEDYIHVYGRDYDHSEKPLATFAFRADADLYVAAPDLLEACKNSVEWLKINCPSIEPNELLAAIAKAERR